MCYGHQRPVVCQVNKVSLKIRAALITEIYRKALSVNSSMLSRFSTGEVCMCVSISKHNE